MDYIEWSTTREKLKTDLQVKTLAWIIMLILVIFFTLFESWFFCSYLALVFVIITYDQIEAQHKLDNLKRPNRFMMPKRTPEESLSDYFNRIIAKLDNVDPSEVTPEYIRQQREKRFYPNARYVNHYDPSLISLTGRELEKLRES